MNIRAQIFGSSKPEEPILRGKAPKGAKADALQSVPVSREEWRRGNGRIEDRHRLSEEIVRVTHQGEAHEVQLINLSGGGAMIRSAMDVKLWDRVELHLGDQGVAECAVRWIREDRIGLEFAHETRLECSSDELASLLRDVINRSFPDVQFGTGPTDEPSSQEAGDTGPEEHAGQEAADAGSMGDHRRERRHPLIWSGHLHLDDQSTTVRVRNISATGAMIECDAPLSVDAEPVLQLNDEATLPATVQWVVGDQVGLRFHRPFDMRLLARSKPQVVAAKWMRPAYLNSSADDGADPWDPEWNRLTLSEINRELEGFLKR